VLCGENLNNKLNIEKSSCGPRKLFFTSDTHFGHANIIKSCNRPFHNANHHDEELILRWNTVVPVDGTVYHLGDFCWGNERRASYIISRLNGKIIVVKGNHDKALKGVVITQIELVGSYHEVFVQDPDVRDGKQHIVLCHYPFESWNKKHWGSLHLHGHTHKPDPIGMANRINVGVDLHDFTPVSYAQIKSMGKEAV